MPITDQEAWKSWVDNNKDGYGGACIKVAEKAMAILDDGEPFDTDELISRANKESDAGGVTGFMAGCVAQMISVCHSRGEEFRQAWNVANQIHSEGNKANESGGVLNPALLNIGE